MSDEKLVRALGRGDLVAIVINIVIGAGIFGLPSRVYDLIGSYSLFAFIGCALIIGLVVLCFAEVSSRFDSTGGMYLYAKESFGPVVGFEVGWLTWIVRITTFAANCNLLLDLLAIFNPAINQGGLRIGLIVLIVAAFTALNFIGVRESTLLNNLFTAGKLLALLVFVAAGIFFIQPANFSFATAPDAGKFSSAMLILIYAFVGFEYSVIPAGEAKNPKKDLPFALLLALAFVAVLFLLVQIVAIGTYPELAGSKRPLADAAGLFMGAAGAVFITIGAAVSISGNLNGGFLIASRIPFAMSEQKELPEFFGTTHAKFKTPYISLFITAVIILVLTIYSSFLSALTIATITRLLVYATTCGALPVLRRRDDAPKAEYTAPMGILVSILALAVIALMLVLWVFTNIEVKDGVYVFKDAIKNEGLAILIFLLAGLAIYFLNKVFGKYSVTERS